MTRATEAFQAPQSNFLLSTLNEKTVARVSDPERRRSVLAALSRRKDAPCDIAMMLENGAALIAEYLNVDRYGVAQRTDNGSVLLRIWDTSSSIDSEGSRVPVEYRAAVDRSNSLAAFALAAEQPVLVQNLVAERRFRDQFLLTQEIQSALVVPMPNSDNASAVLAGFSRDLRIFTTDQTLFAETISHLVGTSIHRDQALRILTEERQFTRTVMETVDAIVLVLSASGRIIRVNRAFEQISGFSSQEVQDRPIWNFLLAPEEVSGVQNTLSRVATSEQSVSHESFVVTKSGERRRVRWSYAALTRSATGADTLIGTGCDITAQRNAEAQVRDSEAARNRAQTQLQEILSIVEGNSADPQLDTLSAAPVVSNHMAPTDSNSHPQLAAVDAEPNQAIKSTPPFSGEGTVDRRHRPRRSFTYCQRIAPMEGDKPPQASMFRVVQCHDISAGGFAFVSPTRPEQSTYVVVLGSAPVLIYVKVSIAHVTPAKIEGRDVFLVGCKYTGRVDY